MALKNFRLFEDIGIHNYCEAAAMEQAEL